MFCVEQMYLWHMHAAFYLVKTSQTKGAAIGSGDTKQQACIYVAVIIKSKMILIDMFDVGPFF